MNPHELEAVRLLGVYTARRFDVWALAGNAKAGCRAHVMSELFGTKMTQAKSGVNALRTAFNQLSNIKGEYIKEREDNFIAWCKEIEAAQGWDKDRYYGRRNSDNDDLMVSMDT